MVSAYPMCSGGDSNPRSPSQERVRTSLVGQDSWSTNALAINSTHIQVDAGARNQCIPTSTYTYSYRSDIVYRTVSMLRIRTLTTVLQQLKLN